MINLIEETENYIERLISSTDLTPKQQKVIKKTFSKLVSTKNLTPYKNESDKKLILKIIAKRRKKLIEVGVASDIPIYGFLNNLESFLNMNRDELRQTMFESDKTSKEDSNPQKDQKKDLNEIIDLLDKLNNVIGKQLKEDGEDGEGEEGEEDGEVEDSVDIVDLLSDNEPDSGVRISNSIEIFIYKQGEKVKIQVHGLPKEIDFEEFKKFLKFSNLWKTKEQLLKMKLPIKLKIRLIYSSLYITGLILVKDDVIKNYGTPVISNGFTIVRFDKKTGKLEIPSFVNPKNLKIKEILPFKKFRKYLKNLEDIRMEIFPKVVPNTHAIDNNNNLFHVTVPYLRES